MSRQHQTSRRAVLPIAAAAVAIIGAFAVLAGWASEPAPVSAAGENSITVPETLFGTGSYSSVHLDGSGFPVITHSALGAVRAVHCNDLNCAGSNETINSPAFGDETDSVLDANGYPVVAFYGSGQLQVMHCNDANCADGDDSIEAPDPTFGAGHFPSIALDASGYPVISYYSEMSGPRIWVVRCNDANCAGGDESIENPNDNLAHWGRSALALASDGTPVVAFSSLSGLALLNCNDANCDGSDESITNPETSFSLNYDIALELDGLENPVIAYTDFDGAASIDLMHCNDVSCAGDDDAFVSLETFGGDVAQHVSLALDGSGYPVLAYHDPTNLDLRIAHCGDANCFSGTTFASPDSIGDVGRHPSIVLDGDGYPVVSYRSDSADVLKLLHCGTPTCIEPVDPTDTPTETPTDTPTPEPCPGDFDCDTYPNQIQPLHLGPANINPALDNCPYASNATQLNFDGNFTDTTGPLTQDDTSRPSSDRFGDLCDSDDDNDGLLDDAGPGTAVIYSGSGASCGGDPFVLLGPPPAPASSAIIAAGFPSSPCTITNNAGTSVSRSITTLSTADTEGNFYATFALPPGYTSPSLQMYMTVDDVARVYLNGNLLGEYCFGSVHLITTANPADFVSGTNLLRFHVVNNPLSCTFSATPRGDGNDAMNLEFEAGVIYDAADETCAVPTLISLNPDTDGDGYLDGAECALITDPNLISSKPTADQCRILAGAATIPTDTDGDIIQDRIEVCGYNTSPSSVDSDGDGRRDGCEVGSLNTLAPVNAGDQLLLAQAITADLSGPFVYNADLNKDGANNAGDQLLLAFIITGGAC